MTEPACPACGGELRPWRAVPGGEPSDPRLYDLTRCSACGSAVGSGQAPPAAAYEQGVYAPERPRGAALVDSAQRVLLRQPVRLLRHAGVAPGTRVLDAGAGTGRLVAALEQAGYRVEGIDPSARNVARAEAAGRRVTRAAIEDHEDTDLDAVVLWHVLEHLDDPLTALERIRSWLRPDGVLLIGVPNLDSLQARLAGDGWLHFDLPRHRVHLTPRGLSILLGRAGFEPGTPRHLVWEHNPGAMWMGLLSRAGMTPGFPFHLLKRNVPARPSDLALTALGLPLFPVALALELLAASARRGGTIAVVARADVLARSKASEARFAR